MKQSSARRQPRDDRQDRRSSDNTEERGDRLREDRDGRDENPRSDDVSEIVARAVDGTGTNAAEDGWGSAGQDLLRLAPNSFADGIGEMEVTRPNPREISNAVVAQDGEIPNSFGISDMVWAWGQFIDHDLDLTEGGDTEFAPIIAPVDDPVFEPGGIISFFRVDPVEGSGEVSERIYHNEITAFIDGSMVYGSDVETAAALREGAYLILNDNGLLVQTEDGGVLAGDVRAAENIALTSLHTLFAREHNRWVDTLAEQQPNLSEEELFDAARMRVEAELQAITFNDFLPILVGEDAISAYEGYDPTVNPGIAVEFSAAAYRFGHSLLSSDLLRLNEDGSSIAEGSIALQDAFLNPHAIEDGGGIDPILRGLMGSTAQELDTMVVEDVRSFLFAPDGSFGLDLASINIQRGRDLGVASYNDLREAFGLERAEDFSGVTSDAEIAATLSDLYDSVDDLDAWIGGLAEDPADGGILGETFSAVIVDQFLRLRDGDAYWSEAGYLNKSDVKALWDTTLADVIAANTGIEHQQEDVFFAAGRIGGTNENDVLTGTDDRDLLIGFEGDDVITAANGDTLVGGSGADRFVFEEGGAFIADFSKADDDMIQIDGSASRVLISYEVEDDEITTLLTLSYGRRSEVEEQEILIAGDIVEADDLETQISISVDHSSLDLIA